VELETYDLDGAYLRVRAHAIRTPVLTASSLDALADASLYFKCENFQRSGSFKFRGACNSVFALSDEQAARGVATHSSGNHGAALALAAQRRDIPCTVVVPAGANARKVEAIERNGARLVRCAPTLEAREDTLSAVLAETGALEIHPYDAVRTIEGQSTCARELLEDEPLLDALIAPIGGGGLWAGSALSARAHNPAIKLYAAEPQGAADAYLGFQRRQRVTEHPIDTIADGLRTYVGVRNFALLEAHAQAVLLASEAEIVAAMRLVWERLKIVIEPSCAVPLAAILRYPEHFTGRRVGVILTGGNVDLDQLPF
jgi:threonine dehydratase